eukprot:s922_g32.t1
MLATSTLKRAGWWPCSPHLRQWSGKAWQRAMDAGYDNQAAGKIDSMTTPAVCLVPWVAAVRAALNHGGTRRPKRDRREAKRKQLQLATVDPVTLAPSVRTVVFRGFLQAQHLAAVLEPGPDASDEELEPNGPKESCVMLLISDERAGKVRHLQESFPQSRVELCWWFDEASVQFRIAGRGLIADSTTQDPELRALRSAVWQRLKTSTKETFFWPHPGRPRGDVPNQAVNSTDLEDAHFAVVVILPTSVDELHLGGRQKRKIYRSSFKEDYMHLPFSELYDRMAELHWEVEDVNP